ncbi:MAG: DUF6152 family protein [Croceibacterium sp.]
MNNRWLCAGLIGISALGLFALPALAHHSFAMFDQHKIVTIEGTVREFQWTNPHSFLEVEVPARSGPPVHWSIELNSPNNLKRQGWTRSSLKTGDSLTLRLNPLRSGQRGGLFLDARLSNGHVLDSGLPKDGTPVNVPRA